MTSREVERLLGAISAANLVALELRDLGDTSRAARLRSAVNAIRRLTGPIVEADPERVARQANMARIDAKRRAEKGAP